MFSDIWWVGTGKTVGDPIRNMGELCGFRAPTRRRLLLSLLLPFPAIRLKSENSLELVSTLPSVSTLMGQIMYKLIMTKSQLYTESEL